MLKAEIIRFEAQDIITASGGSADAPGVTVIPSCSNGVGHNMTVTKVNGNWEMVCSTCGYNGSVPGGTITVGPNGQ